MKWLSMEDKYGFAEKFSKSSIEDLVSTVNSQVGIRALGNARMHYLFALSGELLTREYDCTSFISSCGSMSLKSKVRLDGDRIVLDP